MWFRPYLLGFSLPSRLVRLTIFERASWRCLREREGRRGLVASKPRNRKEQRGVGPFKQAQKICASTKWATSMGRTPLVENVRSERKEGGREEKELKGACCLAELKSWTSFFALLSSQPLPPLNDRPSFFLPLRDGRTRRHVS